VTRRGEIWTVVPLDHPKPRPALVLSVDVWNNHAPDVILVPLTTRPGPSRPAVPHSSLKQASYAKCGSIGAISKERCGERIGRVDEGTMAGVEREVRKLLGL
jgi:mRNA-degrading endonuclease toxin of MazEF toxin-antitoxin module